MSDNTIVVNGETLYIPPNLANELEMRFGPSWRDVKVLIFWLFEQEIKRCEPIAIKSSLPKLDNPPKL